jgi:hypothetical protein
MFNAYINTKSCILPTSILDNPGIATLKELEGRLTSTNLSFDRKKISG